MELLLISKTMVNLLALHQSLMLVANNNEQRTFLEAVLLKFGIACQQQWKTLQAYESLNPLSSVLTCLSV